MSRTLRRLVVLMSAALAVPSTALAAGSFECPWQPIADRPAAAISKLLPSADALGDDAEITATVSLLREHGLSSGAIVDSIISAHCPAVAASPGLSDAQRADAIEAYAARVTNLVYTYSDADQIILDVPLAPAVAAEVQASAAKMGISADAWIASAVEKALGSAP